MPQVKSKYNLSVSQLILYKTYRGRISNTYFYYMPIVLEPTMKYHGEPLIWGYLKYKENEIVNNFPISLNNTKVKFYLCKDKKIVDKFEMYHLAGKL